ncbi:RHS repeat-associated core domain-containing protein, partial [Pseudomonas syringae]
LMRFNSPDSWSPFGEGGVNAYAYIEGNPVGRRDPSGHVGLFTPFKLLYRALKKTPTLTTKSPGVEKIPALLTTRGSKEVTKLSKIKMTDWDSLKEVADSYPARIKSARNDYRTGFADTLTTKQIEAESALDYLLAHNNQRGITAHARRAIKKDVSRARKELKKIPTPEKIRNSSRTPAQSKPYWISRRQKKDRFDFNPEN